MTAGTGPRMSVVRGDITQQEVDAVVNAANTRMRGGGGVDGAIHRAGGPEVLRDCIARFPDGLATGDAGWTTAGALPARFVIHTVGPNYTAGQRDRSLLVSCYRRSLAVADEIGARSVAFPLISGGIYGWPLDDAVDAAVETVTRADTDVQDVRFVAFDQKVAASFDRLGAETPFQLLRAVRVLHDRGFQRTRIIPGMSPSGMHWRLSISDAPNVFVSGRFAGLVEHDAGVHYTTGSRAQFADTLVTKFSSPEQVSQIILDALPTPPVVASDPEYTAWYRGLLDLVEQQSGVPIAYADYGDFDEWEIGRNGKYRQPPVFTGR